MKNTTIIFFLISFLFCTSCEVFVIKGRKVVQEEDAVYSQTTPIGAVKILITELQNENYLAASELLIKADGRSLTATEKYEAQVELARMKRYIIGKSVKREQIDTNAGSVDVTIEFDNGGKAKFITIGKEKLFYIVEFLKE